MMSGHDAQSEYENAKNFASFFMRKIARGDKLNADEIDSAFKINKELRRLFDTFGRQDRGEFDQIYRPLGGWKFYFERNADDLGEIEEYEMIQCEVEASLREGRFPEL